MKNCDFWIFDMDGTLTHAIHDFEWIRQELGLPAGSMILEEIANMSPSDAQKTNQHLYDLEHEVALRATAQPGAKQLLAELRDKNYRIGIVTRNSESLALITLKACGLDHFFVPETVIGRERCEPKPSPAGIDFLLGYWQAQADNTVMIGDYIFDLQAGRNAGTKTVHFDVNSEFPWPEQTDVCVTTLHELLESIK